MKGKKGIFPIILMLLLAGCAGESPAPETDSPAAVTALEKTEDKEAGKDAGVPEAQNMARGTVVRTVDGDTYVLNIDGRETKVRLIGVDTPESAAPSSYYKDNTEEGRMVSDIVKDRITEGSVLYVETDVQETDRYGRLLAYLYFEDGTMVQEWLLGSGYANTATYPPNVKYAERFAELAHKAAESGAGLWDGYFEEEE